MLARTSYFHPSTQTSSQTSDVSGKSAIIAVRICKTVPVSSPALSSLSLPCPGYCLPIPDGHLAISTYPFAMHMSRSVPWCVSIKGTDVVLCSNNCTQLGGDHATPCLPCRSLHNNSTIMGIRHCAIDGALEKTPYHYLAPSHAINLLRQKDIQIKHLQCQAMNNLCSLTTRNHQLEGWKCFALAISRTNIPHLNSLTAAALHNGAGVFGLLKKVDQVAHHVYSPKGYQKVDFERAFLMWKLGGRSAANIAYHTLRLPSIESARQHIQVSPITASSGVPTEAEMQVNLSICFLCFLSHLITCIIGMTMPIDEFKIQERLWWNPRTNMILGVCQEHGIKCSLKFRSIVQANVLRDLLQRKIVHLASKVCLLNCY